MSSWRQTVNSRSIDGRTVSVNVLVLGGGSHVVLQFTLPVRIPVQYLYEYLNCQTVQF